MKKTLTATVMMALILLTGSVTPAAKATIMDDGIGVRSQSFTGYYEAHNENGLTGRSILLFGNGNKSDFNRRFTGKGNTRLMPDSVWDHRYVIAVVKRGEFTTNFTVARVVRDLDILRISYNTSETPTPRSTNSSTLIVAVDRWAFEESAEIVVTENDKLVERIPIIKGR